MHEPDKEPRREQTPKARPKTDAQSGRETGRTGGQSAAQDTQDAEATRDPEGARADSDERDRGAYREVPDPLRDRGEQTARRAPSVWEDTTDKNAPDEAGASVAPSHEDYTVGYGQNADPEDDRYGGRKLAPRDPKQRAAERAAETPDREDTEDTDEAGDTKKKR